MEALPGGFTLDLPEGVFPLSTDSMALAHFCAPKSGEIILDLGSGGGTLGMLLCASCYDCHITGVEISEASHRAALDNIRRNGLMGRMESICADASQVPSLFVPGSFSCCVSNPPYFSGGPGCARNPGARQRESLSMASLMSSAAWALKYGGDFFLVHRPEALGEIIVQGGKAELEIKRLRLLRHREGGAVTLILAQLRKGAKPGLKWEEISLYDASGNPTESYREIYHIQEA